MGNFKRGGDRGGSRGGDRGSRGGFRSGDRDRGPVTMHRATCGDCGRSCEVPFRPMGDKPVFCNDCFGGKRDGDRRGGSDFRDRAPQRESNSRSSAAQSFTRPNQEMEAIKKQLSEVNTKLERLINLFEKKLKTKDEKVVTKGEPVIVVKKEKTKTAGLKSIIKKAVAKKKI